MIAAFETALTLLEQEREAHRLTILELTACREDRDEAAATIDLLLKRVDALDAIATDTGRIESDLVACREGRAADREEAVLSARSAAEQVADLKSRLLGMTAVAADARGDAHAAQARELLARARFCKAPALDTDDCRILDALRAELDPELDQESRAILARLLVSAAFERVAAGRPCPEANAVPRIYTPTEDGSCLCCGRPAGEHAYEAWTDTLSVCPPEENLVDVDDWGWRAELEDTATGDLVAHIENLRCRIQDAGLVAGQALLLRIAEVERVLAIRNANAVVEHDIALGATPMDQERCVIGSMVVQVGDGGNAHITTTHSGDRGMLREGRVIVERADVVDLATGLLRWAGWTATAGRVERLAKGNRK